MIRRVLPAMVVLALVLLSVAATSGCEWVTLPC